MLETPDLRYFGRSDQLHIAFQAVMQFQTENHRLPHLNNQEEANKIVEIAKSINEKHKNVRLKS